MTDDQVRLLMEKYWDGDTTLDEEKSLRGYYSAGKVSAEFEAYTPLFVFFDQSQSLKMESDIAPPQPESIPGPARVISLKWWMQAAAAVIVLVGLFFVTRQQQQTSTTDMIAYEDTFEDPELAYEEFKKAMYYVSGKMNRGVTTTHRSMDKMEPLIKLLN